MSFDFQLIRQKWKNELISSNGFNLFENSVITQILRESKMGFFKKLLKSEIWILWLFTLFENCFTKLTKFRAPEIAKMAVIELLDSLKLISRKIWVTEKSQNLHTVYLFIEPQTN